MTSWIPELDTERPLYLALADALEEAVFQGRLARGAKLPTHRDLAETLGVTVGTVTRGYAEAERRGLVQGITGKGTYVMPDAATDSSLLGAPAGEGRLIEMALVLHCRSTGPDMARGLEALARTPGVQNLLGYSQPGGVPGHRKAGAEWAGRFGIEAGAGDVAVCAGGQHAMTCALVSLVGPGEVLLTEPLTYPGVKTLARSLGIRLAAVESQDEDGMLPDELESVCRREGAKALYLMPSVNNPTTRCMSADRRREIAEVARRLGIWIVEDDAYALLREDRPSAIAHYAPDRTVSICSLSKSLGGGLRTSFVYAPPAVMPGLERSIQNTVWMAPPLMVELAVSWIVSGEAETALAAGRADSETRWALARERLAGYSFEGFRGGYFIWLHLPGSWSGLAFEARAREAGVGVFAAERFCVAHTVAPKAVRVALSGPARLQELEQGLDVLRGLLRQLEQEQGAIPEMPIL